MDSTDAIPTFSALASAIKQRHPTFAYIHVVEPRILGLSDRKDSEIAEHESNDFIRNILNAGEGPHIPLISAGGYDAASAIKTAEEKGGLIAFGRHYIANVSDIILRFLEVGCLSF